MSRKTWVMGGMIAGSLIGGYIPMLWGAGLLSFSSVLWSGIGGILGIYLIFKFTQ